LPSVFAGAPTPLAHVADDGLPAVVDSDVGHRMHDGACLVGQVMLLVDGGAGPFARQLQAALESMGAETLLAPTPAHAREHVSRYDFSAAVIYCGAVLDTVEFRRLRSELGGMPLLLYGTAPPPYVWLREAQFLATSMTTDPDYVVRAVARLLSL
jgi:hypothetical protein